MATCDDNRTVVQVLANLLKCLGCCRQVAKPLIVYPDMRYYICDDCSKTRCLPGGKRDLLIEQLCFSTTLKCSFSVSGCQFTGATIPIVATHEGYCRFSPQRNINNENGDNLKTTVNDLAALVEDCTVAEGSQGQTLEDALIAEMNCPVCLTRIPLSIRECENGHRFCKKCFRRLEKCPVCRGSKSHMSSSVLKHIYVLMMVPCKNVDDGCKVRERVPSIVVHEKKCEFNWESCPLIGKGKCKWQGLRSEVLDHCKACHSEVLRLGPQCSEVLEYKNDRSFKYLYFDGIFFRYHWMKLNGYLFFNINYLGDDTGCRYFYQMEVNYSNDWYSGKIVRSHECFRRGNDAGEDHYLHLGLLRGDSASGDCSINYALTVRRGEACPNK